MKVGFLERGVTIITINIPDKNNNFEDVLIELQNWKEYLNNDPIMQQFQVDMQIEYPKVNLQQMEKNINQQKTTMEKIIVMECWI